LSAVGESAERAVPRDDGPGGEDALRAQLFAAEGRRDPHPFLREAALPGCRHAVAQRMLRDPRFAPPAGPPFPGPMGEMLSRWLIRLDGERHRAMRARFAGVFAPRRVEAYRADIERSAGALLDAVQDVGAMDLVSQYARPLAFGFIANVLGVPQADRAWLQEQLLTMARGAGTQDDRDALERVNGAAAAMLVYFTRELVQCAREPRDDLLSTLARDLPGEPDARADLAANCMFFVDAGYAPTTSLISAGILLLLEDQRAAQRLREHPPGITAAIEEMLRLVSPVSVMLRAPRQPCELDGYRFEPGISRRVYAGAANRDAAVFAEPDRFDPARDPNPHLAFGAGRHFCLGASLARLQGEVAIGLVLERLDELRLAGAPEWRGTLPLRALERLPVAWRAPG
jgi:pimeloyl-[acyl-carrier protein] synthase